MIPRSLFVLLLFASTAHAQPLRPGLWEITARVQGEGMASAPAQTIRTCLTAEEVARGRGPVPGASRGMEHCEVTDPREEPDGASWRFSCSGRPPMSGVGTITYAGERFTQRTTMKTAGSERVALTVTTEGRRVGECPKQNPQ